MLSFALCLLAGVLWRGRLHPRVLFLLLLKLFLARGLLGLQFAAVTLDPGSIPRLSPFPLCSLFGFLFPVALDVR